MKVNIKNVERLIRENFNGNISLFCRTLNLGYTTVWRVLNGTSTGMKKFVPQLIHYCKVNNLNLAEYIEF